MTLELLANSAMRMLLVCAAAWLVLRLARARNPHVETLVWRMMVLAGFALPALLHLRWAPHFEALELPSIVAGAGAAEAAVATPTASMLPVVLASIYFAVALLFTARLAVGLVAMWRIASAARPMEMPDDVRASAHVRSPATFGSIILLPVEAHSWSAERLDVVLAHERAHVRSRDGYWSWLAQLHAAIFWFNPLAWWMQRRLEALAETTSDDAVVAARHDPIAYAELLLDFARHPNRRSVAMSVAESNVSVRIKRLLALTPPARALTRAARWAAVAMLVPVVVFAASTMQAAPAAALAVPAPAADPATAPLPAARAPVAGVSVRMNRPANPDHFYPAVAKAEKMSGYAIVEVDIDVLGQLVDARVLKVEPTDPRFGFADAALEVARNSIFENSLQQVGSMRFKVKFEMKSEPPKE